MNKESLKFLTEVKKKPRFTPQTWSQLWKQIVIWVILAFVLYPIAWVISAAFDPANTIVGQRIIPKNASFINFIRLFDSELQPLRPGS